MDVLSALEELAARNQGLRVEPRPEEVVLSAQEPVPGSGDESF
ncbi:MAG TPA: hypothetical protein VEU33_43545 [Archangium sp.]|nr:hypothetical protein [Archangium sp.]